MTRPSFCICLSLLAVLAARPVSAASVNLCDASAPAGDAATELYGPDGRLLRVTLTEAPADGCVSQQLPVPVAAVRWYTLTAIPAPGTPPRTLALQGYFDADRTRISEVIHAQPVVPDEPSHIPFFADMLPYLRARPFGVEERAGFEGRSLVCRAGEQTAGVALHATALWEQLPDAALELEVTGTGQFALAVADAAREQDERPLALGVLDPGGEAATVRFALPAGRWTSLALFCPQQAATLQLDALKLVAPPRGATPPRATWIWDPAQWRAAPHAVLALARRENLQRLSVTVPVTAGGEVEHAAALAAFLAQARDQGIAVWAVAGDRADVLPESLPALLARARAYLRFNAEHAQTPLAGLQLDIEPYLLPGSPLAPDYWRERYIATVTAVHGALAQQLPLDMVLPVWWGTHPAWGARLLDALNLPGLSLTVMNYRTNADALRAGAMPFLAWGERHARSVAMALEKGRIGVNAEAGRHETRRDYAAAASGELWLLELGGMSLLVLLDEARAGLPGQAYANVGERVIDIGTLSFADAPEDLAEIARTLEAEWSAWPAFAGLALHGLDQELAAPENGE